MLDKLGARQKRETLLVELTACRHHVHLQRAVEARRNHNLDAWPAPVQVVQRIEPRLAGLQREDNAIVARAPAINRRLMHVVVIKLGMTKRALAPARK